MADNKLMPKGTGKSGGLRNIFTRMSDWVSPKRNKPVERTWIDVLKEFEIEPVPVDEHNLKLYYKRRLVGRVFPVVDEFGRDRYKLYIYYYKSDRTNKEGHVMKKLDPDDRIDAELRAQAEKPYWKASKVDISAEDLIWEWLSTWMYNTHAGSDRRKYLDRLASDPGPAERKPADFSKILN